MPKTEPLLSMTHHSTGSHLRVLLFDRFGILMGACGVTFGLLIPALPWINVVWTNNVALILACATLLVCIVLIFGPGRWNIENIIKGLKSEQYVGASIEYALMHKGCAVAHSVRDMAKVGDIDHLVATPRRIWVIETKYRRVPSRKFQEVL